MARDEAGVALDTGAARALEARCRADSGYCVRLTPTRHVQVIARLDGLLAVAVSYLNQGAPAGSLTVIHRLDKVDTAASELVGEVMESTIESRLVAAGISYRRTGRAERLAGFDLVPDFLVPDEFAPAVAIEAKLASDDGTARDKTDRIQALAEMRDRRATTDQPAFELIACIDGRGFGVRRADMRRTLLNTKGKVFTLATLDHLIANTRLRDLASRGI